VERPLLNVFLILTRDIAYVSLAGSFDGHGQATGAGSLGGDGEVGRLTGDSMSQTRSIGRHIAGGD